VLAHHAATLLGLPGVVSVGVGLTEAGDKPAIHVYVNTKATGAPGSAPMPTQIHNVPIRLIETDDIRAR
jgi:hypothetical protein